MKAGFRLHRLEVLNWGTFNGDHHFIMDIPNGEGVCLTGLNGSGKSTLVDALLTLLVPHEYRNYNVAATGTGAKRERSVRSYVLGAYGKEESAESARGQTKYLRSAGMISVLLACFKDAFYQRPLTIAQIHWFTASGDHIARYLIKEADVSISGLGLANLSTSSYAAHFQKDGWTYETTEAAYQGKLQGALRIPDPEALKLLCRTVSLKDIPSVTTFIRSLMLEAYDTAEYLDGIESHFTDLDRIHTELVATRREIEMLEPVEEHFDKFQKLEAEIARLRDIERTLKVMFAWEAGEILDAKSTQVRNDQALLHTEAERLERALEGIQNRLDAINLDLQNNSTYGTIEKLVADEKAYQAELDRARQLLVDLKVWLQALRHDAPLNNETDFVRLKEASEKSIKTESNRHQELLEDRGALRAQIKQSREAADVLGAEILELSNKRTKIPHGFREMRDEICREFGVNEGRLPFVGELLEVPDSENEWRRSIEVLLHNFALSVVVPDELYAQVSGYVEQSKFRRRFTYYRVRPGSGLTASLDSNRVYGKLTIREDAWCRGWLQTTLLRDFSHVCCDTIEQFRAEKERAVTRNMHIKGGERSFKESSRAERDYDLLGWSNERKLLALQSRLNSLRNTIHSMETQSTKLQKSANDIGGGLTLLRKICEISTYREIDCNSIENDLTFATERIKELKESDDELKGLEEAKSEAEMERKSTSRLRDEKLAEAGGCKVRLKTLEPQRAYWETEFNKQSEDFDWMVLRADAMTYRGDSKLGVDSLVTDIARIVQPLTSSVETLNRDMVKARDAMHNAMSVFLTATKDKGYSSDWSSSVRSAESMVNHLEMLRNERFYSQEKEFKEQMQRVLFEDLSIGVGDLRARHDQNQERIEELNRTLKTIEYSEGTYVEIVHRSSKDSAVETFRAKVDECVKQSVAMTDDQMLERFGAVKKLITFIRERRSEAERGANPNNWAVYAMAEHFKDHPEIPPRWHSDADGNSGGQKAKLACTVVAAAMAFRMNHTRQTDSTAFRLVMVDEIFAKSDEVNSAFSLSIFEKFDFQLLLVTPRDGRLKLVMPFVSSFHLAQNPNSDSSSLTSITKSEIELLSKEPTNAEA